MIVTGGKWVADRTVDFDLPADALEFYELRAEDALWRAGGWAAPPNGIWVKYTAGEASIPADLQQITNRLVKEAINTSRRDERFKRFSLADYSYELIDQMSTGVITTDVQAELDQWKRVPMPRY